MKKVGCAKCGGTMNKMAKGGSTTNKLNNPKGYAPAQKGGDNTKMGIYGVPNAGRTDGLGFKKGGSVKIKTGGVAKAKFGATVDVQRGYPGKIRSSEDQGYTAIGKREPARTKFAKGGTKFPDLTGDGKVTKADVLKGRGVIKKMGGSIKKK